MGVCGFVIGSLCFLNWIYCCLYVLVEFEYFLLSFFKMFSLVHALIYCHKVYNLFFLLLS